jgi:hypothetical protein
MEDRGSAYGLPYDALLVKNHSYRLDQIILRALVRKSPAAQNEGRVTRYGDPAEGPNRATRQSDARAPRGCSISPHLPVGL